MSTSNLRMLVDRIPKVSLKGVAYVAAANFMARSVILIRNYITNYFHSEMVLLYGATLDTRILLFFQSIYMIPMFLLGVLVFYGIERESFNIVLYPTLMLLFLILIRYGSESALLVVHWEDHKFNQTPELLFSLLQDVIFIVLLLLYVYICLAFTPIKPTPTELVESGGGGGMHPQHQMPSTSQNHAYPEYVLKQQVPKDSVDKVDEIEQQKQRNSLLVRESGGATSRGVIETDLDAVPTPAAALQPTSDTIAPAALAVPTTDSSSPVVVVKIPKLKKRAYLAKKASTEAAEPPPPEPEKPAEPAEPELDFWGSMNGDAGETPAPKPDGFKTTSV